MLWWMLFGPHWNRLSDIEERGREDLRVTGPTGFHRHV